MHTSRLHSYLYFYLHHLNRMHRDRYYYLLHLKSNLNLKIKNTINLLFTIVLGFALVRNIIESIHTINFWITTTSNFINRSGRFFFWFNRHLLIRNLFHLFYLLLISLIILHLNRLCFIFWYFFCLLLIWLLLFTILWYYRIYFNGWWFLKVNRFMIFT